MRHDAVHDGADLPVAFPIVSEWFVSYGWGEVAPGLFTGSYPQDARDVAALTVAGITAVVNLCHDDEYRPGARAEVSSAYAAAGAEEHRLASDDYGTVSPELLDRGTELIGAALDRGAIVYVHCRAGWQRSATLAAAALTVRGGIEPAVALAAIRARRPMARPLPHQERDLRAWWNHR